jgi:hypothetical protein
MEPEPPMNSLLRILFRNVLRNGHCSLITLSPVLLSLGGTASVRGLINGMSNRSHVVRPNPRRTLKTLLFPLFVGSAARS